MQRDWDYQREVKMAKTYKQYLDEAAKTLATATARAGLDVLKGEAKQGLKDKVGGSIKGAIKQGGGSTATSDAAKSGADKVGEGATIASAARKIAGAAKNVPGAKLAARVGKHLLKPGRVLGKVASLKAAPGLAVGEKILQSAGTKGAAKMSGLGITPGRQVKNPNAGNAPQYKTPFNKKT